MDLNASLAELLEQPAKPPTPPTKTWAPRVVIEKDELTLVTEPETEAKQELTEDDVTRILREHELQPDKWVVTRVDSSRWQNSGGTWLYSHKLSAKPADLEGGGRELPDLDDLERTVAAIRRHRAPSTRGRTRVKPAADRSANIVISDEQFGKTGSRGGTADLWSRYEYHLSRAIPQLLSLRASECLLWLPGDAIENFESTASQERTNDLSLIQQLRLARRATFKTVDRLAGLFDVVKVMAVPSNHSAVRRGKGNMGHSGEDFGVEMLAQVQDIAEANPGLYGHVQFHTPSMYEECLNVTAVGGVNVGLVHGHQSKGGQEGIDKWWAGQSHGRTPVSHSDLLINGHFHSASLSISGDNRWRFGAPTLDNGSDWYVSSTGNSSGTGILTFSLDGNGWGDYHIA